MCLDLSTWPRHTEVMLEASHKVLAKMACRIWLAWFGNGPPKLSPRGDGLRETMRNVELFSAQFFMTKDTFRDEHTRSSILRGFLIQLANAQSTLLAWK